MQNFTYHPNTKIVFGKDAENSVADNIKQFGGTGVLLHYGGGSAVRSGLIPKIKGLLEDAGIKYIELSGVKPNPRLSLVREGIQICKDNGLNFILAVGGGSVIDSSKAIALGLGDPEQGDVWDFFLRKREPKVSTPLGVILTLASAGSEGSTSCVIRNEDEDTKRGLNTQVNRPTFAILNPTLGESVSKYSLACGITDTIMHTLDRYFAPTKGTLLTDALGEGLVRTVMHCAPRVLKDPTDYEAMANIFLASTFSHNDLTELGKPKDMAVHGLERAVSGSFDNAHPACLAIIWPHWARFIYKQSMPNFVQFATNIMGVTNDPSNPDATALAGIAAFESFLKSIGMPTSFKEAELNITDSDIDNFVHYSFFFQDTIGHLVPVTREDAKVIFNNARG